MLELTTKHRAVLNLTQEDCRVLLHNIMNHDRSKFSPEQFEPYIELNEYYHQRKNLKNHNYEYPPGVSDTVTVAIQDHYNNENHHPEACPPGGLLKWDEFNAYETACDLQAMADEFGEGSCRNYFENIWIPRQSKNFYDDYNWAQVQAWINSAILCFEGDMDCD
jgi:hypothetical protein